MTQISKSVQAFHIYFSLWIPVKDSLFLCHYVTKEYSPSNPVWESLVAVQLAGDVQQFFIVDAVGPKDLVYYSYATIWKSL